jgi:hypothetical protein
MKACNSTHLLSLNYSFSNPYIGRMSTCPPGFVFNPESYRCVKDSGRIGKRLQKNPVISPILTRRLPTRFQTSQFNLPMRQATRRISLPVENNFMERQSLPQMLTRLIHDSREIIPVLRSDSDGCEEGKVRNPITKKCIKKDGRTQRRLLKQSDSSYQPIRRETRRNYNYQPIRRETRRVPAEVRRTEVVPEVETHKANKIPIGDKETMRAWMEKHCSNTEEPFTGRSLRALQPDEMSSVLRTSAGTCLRSDYLDAYVRKERGLGREVRDPLKGTPLTLSNMDILGRVLRRTIPNYRVPQITRRAIAPRFTRNQRSRGSPEVIEIRRTRDQPSFDQQQTVQRHAGLPDHLKFFVGKDARSGDDFYSIYYYDKRYVQSNANGLTIPSSAIKIDIGLIPSYVSLNESRNPLCTTAALVETILSLHKKRKLVRKLGNEYTAAIELPTDRAQWKTPDGAIQKRFFQQVCEYLRALNR